MTMKPIRARSLVKCVSVAALAVAAASCGDVVRSSRSPVMMLVNNLVVTNTPNSTMFSDVASASGAVVDDSATATLTAIMKDISVTAPSSNNKVTINRYRVEYRRADGHNVPGVDVPYPFEAAATVTVTPNATSILVFEIVRHTAKGESPLVQLRSSSSVISTVADVTFYGADAVGNDVSATGSMLINFGDVN
jgi:hypothetical protein